MIFKSVMPCGIDSQRHVPIVFGWFYYQFNVHVNNSPRVHDI